ncbi:hypothetical protein MVEN_00105500 [Mycena venus]|uniref:Uncharacterized protein n=1 Tax=Mycena venus TaxID=2733690 RepID=A0A8H6Z7Z7_9AGAR|nr:hypothetical protein MVEN_00105500 [Mycena venus]
MSLVIRVTTGLLNRRLFIILNHSTLPSASSYLQRNSNMASHLRLNTSNRLQPNFLMRNNPLNTLLRNLLSIKPRSQLPARVGGTCEVDLVDTGKAARQKLTAIANRTAELVIFHTKGVAPLQLQVQVTSLLQMQLLAHPTLMNDLQINPMTWFDLWVRSDWKTVQASTTFEIDRNHPSIIRLRPSLMIELPIEDRPGIDRFHGSA